MAIFWNAYVTSASVPFFQKLNEAQQLCLSSSIHQFHLHTLTSNEEPSRRTNTMPSSTTKTTSRPSGPTGLTRGYLFTYNTTNLLAWGTCLLYTSSLVPTALTSKTLPTIFNTTFNPLLLATQSLALLEVLHSLIGLVRAPVMTTAMQVASRLLVVWGILAQFGGGIVGGKNAQIGDYAYLGCVGAWGITEVIRYGFFAITLSGGSVPAWWTWLR